MGEGEGTRPASPVPDLLARCTFPPAGTALACAVSGGADSLALLVLATAAGCDVTAFHVDHGLRAGSSAEAGVVAAAAERLGARFESRTVSVEPGPNLEARARAARFAALPEGVATGHTMDDQAETILLNLLRGAGADGLAGMEPGLRHPLLGLRRSETHGCALRSGLVPVCDASNRDPAFARNRVRHELLPLVRGRGRARPRPSAGPPGRGAARRGRVDGVPGGGRAARPHRHARGGADRPATGAPRPAPVAARGGWHRPAAVAGRGRPHPRRGARGRTRDPDRGRAQRAPHGWTPPGGSGWLR